MNMQNQSRWTCKINQDEHAKSIKITKTHFLLTLAIWTWVNIQPDLRISLLSQCECLNSFWDISNSSLDVLSDCCISLPDHDLTYFCEINFWKLKYVGKTLRLWHLVDMVVGGKETVSWRRGDGWEIVGLWVEIVGWPQQASNVYISSPEYLLLYLVVCALAFTCPDHAYLWAWCSILLHNPTHSHNLYLSN